MYALTHNHSLRLNIYAFGFLGLGLISQSVNQTPIGTNGYMMCEGREYLSLMGD